MKKRGLKGTVAMAALLALAGIGLIAYPFATDLRYEFAQWQIGIADAQTPASSTGIALPEGAVAHLLIDAIGLDAYVVEGTDDAALNEGPGHYPDTPLPGQSGNAAIAGHRTMYGHVFHDLHLLSPGDEIVTSTGDAVVTYVVTETLVVDPSQVDVVAPTDYDRLTLTTCHPIGSAAQRLVVVAELAG